MTPNADPIDRSEQTTAPEPRHPRRRALPNGQVRLMCLGMALAQLITGAPLWLIVPVDAGTTIHRPLAGAAAAIALAAAGLVARTWMQGGPISRTDLVAAIMLVCNPVWIMLVVPVVIGRPDDVRALNYAELTTFVIYGGLVVLHLMPAILALLTVRGRLGASDSDWSPHEVSNGDRGSALLGLSILSGGWAAILGVIGLLLVYGRDDVGADDLLDLCVFAVFAQGFGMLLGLFAAVVSSTIPASTRLDRSVPRIFLPAMAAGGIGTAIFPLLGIPAAAVTLLVMCLVTRRTCRLFAYGHCQRCDYDLAGLAEPICPECGMPVAFSR